jgi:two-component system sensor histidine kinase KdpD
MGKGNRPEDCEKDIAPSAFAATITDLGMANRLLASLSSIVQLITAQRLTYEARIDRVLRVILDHLGVEQGSIMILAGKTLVIKAASRPELIGVRQPLSEASVASWVALHKKPLFIPDINKDHRFHKRHSAYRKNSLLSVPVLQNNRLIGVINVSDKAGHTDLLKGDIAFLIDFSALVLSLIIQESLAEQAKQQRNTLRQRNLELRRQETMRAELSRMLIHDLKGPLSEVVANLDILSYSATDDTRELVTAAQTGCDQAVRMAENLATIGRIEDNKLELLKHEIAPVMLLKEALSNVRGLATLKHITLASQLAPDLPTIRLDRVLILRVLQNLIMNALHYSQPGHTVTVGCEPVVGRRQLCFFVADEGPGVPEGEQTLIFDKYVRLQRGQDLLTGTGLGLYFCKLTVEKHRGEIGMENRATGGSRFYFTLPLP